MDDQMAWQRYVHLVEALLGSLTATALPLIISTACLISKSSIYARGDAAVASMMQQSLAGSNIRA